jgi:anti-anti-sigma factor
MQYFRPALVAPFEPPEVGIRPEGCRIWSMGHLPVVALPAEVDILNAHLLHAALLEACIGAPVVVVDMTATTHIDASGFNVLVTFRNLLRRVDGELRLVIRSAHVRRVMGVIGLDQIFRIFTDLDEALPGDRSRALPYERAA